VADVIVTVTANPALDVTYTVDRFVAGAVHRVTDVRERPGGKGVNVARVLHQLGEPVVATGLADAAFGARVEAAGPGAAFVPALRSVRRTVVVHDGASTTGLWEPGIAPADPAEAAERLLSRVAQLLGEADGLVVSGSLPAGVDPELPARLARLAADRSIPVLVDVDDKPMRHAAHLGGAVLMPNLEELGRLVGRDLAVDDVPHEARVLAERTRAPVVVTLGAAGMVAVAGDCWTAKPSAPAQGNPTGAGDAAAAATIRGLVNGATWPEILRDAVALSASAVVSPVAGEVDLDRYREGRPAVQVEALDLSSPRTPR
jgi:tagatose 6-phosphate kinase